jgi:hypothetical protein
MNIKKSFFVILKVETVFIDNNMNVNKDSQNVADRPRNIKTLRLAENVSAK